MGASATGGRACESNEGGKNPLLSPSFSRKAATRFDGQVAAHPCCEQTTRAPRISALAGHPQWGRAIEVGLVHARARFKQQPQALLLAIVGGHPQRGTAFAHICPAQVGSAHEGGGELVGSSVDGGVVQGGAQILRRDRDVRV